MQPIITVEGLCKQYHIGVARETYGTLRDSFSRAIKAPFKRLVDSRQSRSDTVWALKDVGFAINPGEVVGVIGRNGAGKSTLLKILSRITEPTTGKVDLYGRVASLLEVGTGFHPELTGRENIYLNGAILGMGKSEITRKFDEIVDFAEVEKFIETPVKRYSSGMYLRLAFAVAAHMDPEILLVDEVLAVGDAQFQKKCLGRMTDIGKEGRTVLFVSHNLAALQNLCSRAIWLTEGGLAEDGPSSTVVSNYLKSAHGGVTEQLWPDPSSAPGCDSVRMRLARVRSLNESSGAPITIETPFALEFEYWNLEPDNYLNLSLIIYDEKGTVVFNAVPSQEPVWHGHPFPRGLFRSICGVPGGLMNDGRHTVELLVVKNQAIVLYRLPDILAFDIQDVPDERLAWYGKRIGVIRPRLDWTTEMVESPDFTGSDQSSISAHESISG